MVYLLVALVPPESLLLRTETACMKLFKMILVLPVKIYLLR
jgi:hypothetical protein